MRVAEPPWLKQARAEGRVTERTINAAALGAGFTVQSNPQGESEFAREVIALAQDLGWLVAHFRSVPVVRADGTVYWQTPVQGDGSGFPDLIMVRGDRCVVAELKFGKNDTTPEQEAWLESFRRAGIPAYKWWPEDMAEIQTVLA